ncbi:MAG: AAA family ATPase [Polyangiaceae bacterium]|nr:AAA family ATPase [Polyangiaceae bacterium]
MDGSVANARLLSLKLQRFKSYADETEIPLSPLTIILGRNNSGKSSIIQALLLLKQTLALPRPEVPLHLEGLVDAVNLREITYGWPAAGPAVPGPRIGIRWASQIDLNAADEKARSPALRAIANFTGTAWLAKSSDDLVRNFVTELVLDYAELEGRTALTEVTLASYINTELGKPNALFVLKRQENGSYLCHATGGEVLDHLASVIQVELDHFLPYFLIDRRNVGPRDKQRAWYNAYLFLFAQPMDDLKQLLSNFIYLGSMRTQPPTLYRPASVPPDDIGVSGEYAAQMLHARRTDRVHYPPPLRVEGDAIYVPDTVRARTLVDGVNDVLNELLGMGIPLRIDDVKDLGFRLFFGQASLQHVGRGLSYLLPVIQLGLVADPLRFEPTLLDMPLDDYEKACRGYTHCALEEPESHLHPKAQTRLAHWFVALAMARRQLLVETHSDHLVRRLRGLAARAKPGSAIERWLLENVHVLQIEQVDGRSIVKQATLTPQGNLESWPADFMDEAMNEERSIYDASLDKPAEPAQPVPESPAIEHDAGDEPDIGP